LFNITPWKAEVRRRIFWQIFQLDTFVAVTGGLPPLMNDEFFDTRPISELKDMLYGTDEGEVYEAAVASGQRPPDDPDNPTTRKWESHVSVVYLLSRARYDFSSAVSRILKMHLGTKRITREHMLVMRKILGSVDRNINAAIRRIPTKGIPELGFEPDKDEHGHSLVSDYDTRHANPPGEDDIKPFIDMTPREGLDDHTVRYHWNTLAAFHKFARIVLSLLVDKLYCVSFMPLLKNAKSKFWACARQCALRSCHGYMRKFICLATDTTFQPFQWSWPGAWFSPD
jgi:Fungal specific transcription factor domain